MSAVASFTYLPAWRLCWCGMVADLFVIAFIFSLLGRRVMRHAACNVASSLILLCTPYRSYSSISRLPPVSRSVLVSSTYLSLLVFRCHVLCLPTLLSLPVPSPPTLPAQFVIVAAFDHTDPSLPVEERIARGTRRCGVSITCERRQSEPERNCLYAWTTCTPNTYMREA